MRLTCPNCDAQYEVPDQVVPIEGRDVQCSNCGNTWYQDHPDNPQPAPEEYAEAEDHAVPEHEEYEPEPETDFDYEPDIAPDDATAPPERDDTFTDVLREEAAREARLRATEAAGGLESQPDLGLEPPEDDAGRRAQEARTRMARLRGEESAPDPLPETESRRGLLPDIEEINSSLKSSERAITPALATEIPAAGVTRKSGGFSRGIAIALVIAAVLLLVYTNAPRISEALPLLDPVLNAYVAFIDNARTWLDQKIGALTPTQ